MRPRPSCLVAAALSFGLAALAPGVGRAAAPPGVEGAAAEEAAPGSIVVDLRDDLTAADVAAFARDYGLALRPASSQSATQDRIEVASVDPSVEGALLQRLEADGRVEAAEPLSLLYALFVPDDPLYRSKQWHLTRVGAEQAWEYGCGRGVTVAVVDTGVACFDKGPFSRGSDLRGTRCGGGYDFVNDGPDAADDQGHGTHVAGTIGQTTNNGVGASGLAYCARLMPVKVLNRRGVGTVAAVAQGIRYAADHGAQVINLSLGGPRASRVLEGAVRHALGKGVTVVAAAGNSGGSVAWPAAYPGVIAVSATDANDRLAWFSSRGPEIALAAPGVDVTQQTVCDGGLNRCELFGTFSGTSMAAPHVAGAAALLIGMGVSEPSAVRDALQGAARPKGDGALYGAGIVDGGRALARAHGGRALARLGALLALGLLLGRHVRRRGGALSRGAPFRAGALLGSVGLVPVLPWLRVASHAGPARWAVELLGRPFAEWDLAVSAAVHRFLPLANGLPALALAAVLFGTRAGRPFVGGFALGSAAYVAALAVSVDVPWPLGAVLFRAWAAANILVCLWLARVAGDTRRF